MASVKQEYDAPIVSNEPATSTDTVATAAEFVARDEMAKVEEQKGTITFTLVQNDSDRLHLEYLIGVKGIFSKQLPKMPREYISRIVLDPVYHRSLIIHKNRNVIGGICFRTFRPQGFIEIVFCAITSSEQVKGYGSHLMNHLKEAMSKEKIYTFLTYADNFATGYFRKQGFTKEITLNPDFWKGYIKDYDGGTLMECVIHPAVPSFIHVPQMVQRQREALLPLIYQVSGANIIHPGLQDFKKGAKRIKPSNIPGLNEPRVEEKAKPKEDTTKSLQAELSGYLKKLKNHSSVWPFLKPVDIDEVPDYLDVIKDPIGTLGAWLTSGNYYITRDIFFADLHRMIKNAKTFNPKGNTYHTAAVNLEKLIDQLEKQ